MLETILGDRNLMALDVYTIIPELTYAPVMEPLRHLLPVHEASLEDAHALARQYAGKMSLTAGQGRRR